MPNRRISVRAANAMTAAVFIVAFAAMYFLASPRGNPDPMVCLAVEAVFALAIAMLFNAAVRPHSQPGDRLGLGAPSVTVGVATVSLALAFLAFAFVNLLHPVMAGGLAAVAAVCIVFRGPIVRLTAGFLWGAPLGRSAPASRHWAAQLAEISAIVKNETFLKRLSELQVLCANQPQAAGKSSTTELDQRITGRIKELRGSSLKGDLSRETELAIAIRNDLRERLAVMKADGGEKSAI